MWLGRLAVVLVWGIVFGGLTIGASAQMVRLDRVSSLPGSVDLVRAQGERAYVVAGNTFTVYDMSSPATPTQLGSYTFPEEIWEKIEDYWARHGKLARLPN